MDALHIGFILYYVFGVISIIGNLYVAISLMRIGLLSPPTKLVLYLHLTLVLENLTTFPNVFSSVGPICEMVAIIRTYSGIANSFVVVCLVLLYRYWFVEDSWKIMPILTKYREFIIFVLPFISLLPLITNSYGDSNSYFCTLRKHSLEDKVWGVVLYISIIAAAICFSCLVMTHTVTHVFIAEPRYAKLLFRSIGFYVIFSIFTWIPRAIAQVGILTYLSTFYLTYISGILYVMIFLYEREYFQAYEKNTEWNTDLQDFGDRDSGYFSWDIGSLSNLSNKSLHQSLNDQQAGLRSSAPKRDSQSMNTRSIQLENIIRGSNPSITSTSNPINTGLSSEDGGSNSLSEPPSRKSAREVGADDPISSFV